MRGRDGLRTRRDVIGSGDERVIARGDRAARSMGDLRAIDRAVAPRGATLRATLRATERPIDTPPPAGQAFLDMLGVVAAVETNLRRERPMGGIAEAKARGLCAASTQRPHGPAGIDRRR
jgi:DNA invertase Pin-like site-specific DNA recombinase